MKLRALAAAAILAATIATPAAADHFGGPAGSEVCETHGSPSTGEYLKACAWLDEVNGEVIARAYFDTYGSFTVESSEIRLYERSGYAATLLGDTRCEVTDVGPCFYYGSSYGIPPSEAHSTLYSDVAFVYRTTGGNLRRERVTSELGYAKPSGWTGAEIETDDTPAPEDATVPGTYYCGTASGPYARVFVEACVELRETASGLHYGFSDTGTPVRIFDGSTLLDTGGYWTAAFDPSTYTDLVGYSESCGTYADTTTCAWADTDGNRSAAG